MPRNWSPARRSTKARDARRTARRRAGSGSLHGQEYYTYMGGSLGGNRHFTSVLQAVWHWGCLRDSRVASGTGCAPAPTACRREGVTCEVSAAAAAEKGSIDWLLILQWTTIGPPRVNIGRMTDVFAEIPSRHVRRPFGTKRSVIRCRDHALIRFQDGRKQGLEPADTAVSRWSNDWNRWSAW